MFKRLIVACDGMSIVYLNQASSQYRYLDLWISSCDIKKSLELELRVNGDS
jgi:hypothetical protein